MLVSRESWVGSRDKGRRTHDLAFISDTRLPTPDSREPAIVPRARYRMDLHNTTATAPHPIYSPTPVPVEQFVDGIRELSAGLITKQKIYDFLATYEIRSEDLE